MHNTMLAGIITLLFTRTVLGISTYCSAINQICLSIIPTAGITSFFGCTGISGAAVAACQGFGGGPLDPFADACAGAMFAGIETSCLSAWWVGSAFTAVNCANVMRCNFEHNDPDDEKGECKCIRSSSIGDICLSIPPLSQACGAHEVGACSTRGASVGEPCQIGRRRGGYQGGDFMLDVIYRLNPQPAEMEAPKRRSEEEAPEGVCDEACGLCDPNEAEMNVITSEFCQFSRLVKGHYPEGDCRECLAENYGVFESRNHQEYAAQTVEGHCAMLDCLEETGECVDEHGPFDVHNTVQIANARASIYNCVRGKSSERCGACLDDLPLKHCDQNSGECWCVDATGEEMGGSRITAEQGQELMLPEGHLPGCDVIIASAIKSETWLPENASWQGKYLRVFNNVLWQEAHDNCRSWGMELAAPCSDDEARAVHALHPNWPMWIGLSGVRTTYQHWPRKFVVDSTWTNVRDTCEYRNWYGYPNFLGKDDPSGYCGYMSGFCRPGKYCAYECDKLDMFYACQEKN